MGALPPPPPYRYMQVLRSEHQRFSSLSSAARIWGGGDRCKMGGVRVKWGGELGVKCRGGVRGKLGGRGKVGGSGAKWGGRSKMGIKEQNGD